VRPTTADRVPGGAAEIPFSEALAKAVALVAYMVVAAVVVVVATRHREVAGAVMAGRVS
jgi:hypothetical protein